mmetsp:Transcript_34044/g.58497  ORF Transcript_34044/g.58497 Transcript_34044/m.58497 type:complete len:202 (+) Transcript_34044:282-887(+)
MTRRTRRLRRTRRRLSRRRARAAGEVPTSAALAALVVLAVAPSAGAAGWCDESRARSNPWTWVPPSCLPSRTRSRSRRWCACSRTSIRTSTIRPRRVVTRAVRLAMAAVAGTRRRRAGGEVAPPAPTAPTAPSGAAWARGAWRVDMKRSAAQRRGPACTTTAPTSAAARWGLPARVSWSLARRPLEGPKHRSSTTSGPRSA